MRNLARKPLPWVVLAECAIVAALVVVAWHLVAAAPLQEVPAAPAAPAPSPAGAAARAISADVTPRPPPPPPLPGLNVDASFWQLRLAELNRGDAAFEAL